MQDKKLHKLGKYVIELIVPDKTKDTRFSGENNINAFDDTGSFLWNISALLQNYSDKNGLKYYDEMYFEIREIDDENIYCIGFFNHCYINLNSAMITKIVNNR